MPHFASVGQAQGLIEYSQYISPDEKIYRFNTGTDKFILSGLTGLGMPDITYRTQRGPFQDGVTPLGFVLEPRVIGFLHRRNGGCRQDYWDNRSDLINLLRPNRQSVGSFQTGVLRKILPDRSNRDLNVLIQRGPEFLGKQRGRWDEFGFSVALQFVAHDPIFFDPSQILAELSLPDTTDELAFPITFSIKFSSGGGVPTDEITINGTWETFPTIILQGPLREPVIENITTQEKIKFTSTIASGRTVTITLEAGNKTVTDDLGNNRIGELTTDSDLATFHLAADPEAPGGINQIGVTAALTGVGSRIALKYFERYIGI